MAGLSPFNSQGPQLYQNGGLQTYPIPFVEVMLREHQSPKESIGNTNEIQKASRILRVPWDTRYAATEAILGISTVDPTTNTLKRGIPEQHPLYPQLVATKVDAEPFANWNLTRDGQYSFELINGAPISSYKFADLHISYEVVPYYITPDNKIADPTGGDEILRWTHPTFRPAADYLTIRQSYYKVTDTTTPAINGRPWPGEVARLLPTVDVVIEWFQVPTAYISFGRIIDFLGHVNCKQFNASDPEDGAWTYLFTGGEMKRRYQADGTVVWDNVFTFKYRASGWNNFYYPAPPNANFYLLTIDGVPIAPGHLDVDNPTTVYGERDLNYLFVSGKISDHC